MDTSTAMTGHGTGAARRTTSAVLQLSTVGGAVALALGTYGRVHTPTGEALVSFGFADTLTMKAWLATGAAVLALAQLASALRLYGKVGRASATPAWVAPLHRWSGTAAFVVTLPVAYHCLWSLGLQAGDLRVAAHSVAGCLFYGAFTAKMLALRSDRLPSWGLPLFGGLLVALLTTLWLTSSLWFFTTVAA